MDLTLVLGTAMITIFLIAVSSMMRPSRLRCPECKSDRVNIVSKEQLGMRQGEHGGGGSGGGHSVVIIDYKVRYRCIKCDSQWAGTTAETA